MPKWLAALDTMSLAGAAGVGAFLVVPNPKNTVLAISAGIVLASGATSVGEAVGPTLVFVLVASSIVIVPVVVVLLVGDRWRSAYDRMREWLVRHNAIVIFIVLGVTGVSMIFEGVAAFRG